MNYVDHQNEFMTHVALLILKAQDLGFQVTGGELERPKEIQLVYVHGKRILEKNETIVLVDSIQRSKTMNSKHLVRKAIDLNFFKGKQWVNGLKDKEEIKNHLQPLGDYWESLHPNNSWGGNWKSFFDAPHFERR